MIAPIITPWLKYFCTKGYKHIIGTVVMMMTAYFIRFDRRMASWAARPSPAPTKDWLVIRIFLTTS